MEYPATPAAENPQYQPQDHHQYQQQYQHQPYDPAQAQAYEAYYYAYHHQQQQPPPYDAVSAYHHQHQQYYPQEYPPASYYAPQPAPPPDPAAAQPPPAAVYSESQVPHPPTTVEAFEGYGYAPPAVAEQQLPVGLNPPAAAAVEALSQLTQFAGSMSAAERAMAGVHDHQNPYLQRSMQYGPVSIHPGVGGRSPYRGVGRRGGGPFRGGGSFGHHPARQGGAPSPVRGRGRGRTGRGGGRRAQPSIPAPASDTQPQPPFLKTVWCEICSVECNSLFILNQHNSGKRHKKTAQRFEEMKARKRLEMGLPIVEESNAAALEAEPNNNDTVASESTIDAVADEKAKEPPTSSENTTIPVTTIEPKLESKALRQPGPSNPAAGTIFGGPKRKMVKSGRGGKRMRVFEEPRSRYVDRPKEPTKPREQPKFCTLCTVMCDTHAVFQIHLSGKKHVSKIQQFRGQDMVYGPVAAFIPPDQPTNSKVPEPLFYGLKPRDMIQQEAFELDGLQQENLKGEVLPVNGGEGAAATDAEGQNAVENEMLLGVDIKVEKPNGINEEAGGGDIERSNEPVIIA